METLGGSINVLFFICLIVGCLALVSCDGHGTSSNTFTQSSPSETVRSLCGKTRYPERCMDSMLDASKTTTNPKDLVTSAAKHALQRVEHAYRLSATLAAEKSNSTMERDALLDCHELMDDARDEMTRSITALGSLTNASASTLKQQLNVIKVLFSASLSFETACTDGCSLSSLSARSKKIIDDEDMAGKDITNCLGLADGLRRIAEEEQQQQEEKIPQSSHRRLLSKPADENDDNFSLTEDGYPEWMSVGERKLLQSPSSSVTANVIVALDGSGQYTKVQDAVDNIPSSYSGRYIIYIKKGVYKENVEIAKKYQNLMFLGDGVGQTIITGNRNVALQGYTTFRSATVAITAPGFMAKAMTFQNTAGPAGHQAVAVRAGGDLAAFDTCSFEGYQDTLYALAGRQFYRSCSIYGTVDFIFGNAIAVFQSCNLYARLPSQGQKNIYTAQGRTIPDDPSGYSFQSCNLLPAADFVSPPYSVSTYLGRPWKAYSRTVFLKCNMGSLINPAGWSEWDSTNPYTDTLYYGEYQNTGPGSSITGRVKWSGVHSSMTVLEASLFSAENFISASTWLPQLGLAYENL